MCAKSWVRERHVDHIELMLDVMGLDGLFRNNPSSHWMRCLTTKFRHLAKKLHPDKPGGSAAQMEELKYAYDYLQGIVQQWIAVTDWTRCQVQCHCSLCLCLYRDKVGQCPKCFEKYGHNINESRVNSIIALRGCLVLSPSKW